MVPTPTPDEVRELICPRVGGAVSLLLPVTPPGEGRITLRNLARSAASRLEAMGMRAADVRVRLAPVDAVLEDHELWQRPAVGLALYIDQDGSMLMPGPQRGEPLAVVGSRFHVKHLLDGVPQPRFAVLTLSRKTSHLFTGDASRLDEVAAGGLPMAMEEVLRYDEHEPQLQSHGSARRGGGGVVGSFHGQGGKREQGEDLHRYLRAVSVAVEAALTDECLVLAGTEELIAAFRKTTSYAHLATGEIPGSGERLAAADLAAAAGPLVHDAVIAHREAMRSRLAELSGTGAATLDLGATVTAACDGRVEALFVAGDTAVWGHYDAAVRRIDHLAADDGGDDLLDLAAVETWRHGGEVYVLAEADLPGPWPAAALLRY